MKKTILNKENILIFSLNLFLILYYLFLLNGFKINNLDIYKIYKYSINIIFIFEIILILLKLLFNKKIKFNINNYLNNFIFYISIPLISNIYFKTFFETTIQTKLGFLYSYFIGIFLILNFSLFIKEIKNNEETKTIKKTNSNKLDKLNLKLITTFFLTIIYIILIINNTNILNKFNIPPGIINFINYSLKILLFSGICIPLNIFLEKELYFNQKKLNIILGIKLLIFIILSSLCLYFFKIKGLLYTISTLEFLHFIFNIIYIEILQRNNK